jgi:hypothetical protein
VQCASARRRAPELGPEQRAGARRGAERLRAMSVCQSTVSQSVTLPVRQSISLSVRQSLSQTVSYSVSQSACQSLSHSVSHRQSLSQSPCQSLSQSVSLSSCIPSLTPYYLLYPSITVAFKCFVLCDSVTVRIYDVSKIFTSSYLLPFVIHSSSPWKQQQVMSLSAAKR